MGTTAFPVLDERPAPGFPPRPLPALPLPPAAPRSWRPVSQSAAIRAVVVILFGALLTAAVTSWSFRHGRLILLPDYDDVGYMEDAARRLRIIEDSGVGMFLGEYAKHPPHSPYGTLVGLASFLVFGIHDWAPYVASVVLVCGYFALSDRLLRGLPLWQKLLVFAFVLSVPMVVRSAAEFRPDHASALLLCGGLILLLEGPFVGSSFRHKAGAGALVGLAVLAKPPMFVAAGLLIGWALLVATAADFLAAGREGLGRNRRPTRQQVALAWAATLLPAILIPLPHFIFAGAMVVNYIYDNMFGQFKDVWQTQGPLKWHLNYYLFGEGGQIMLGGRVRPRQFVVPRHLVLLTIILVAGVVQVLWRRRRAEMVRAGRCS